jgi:hypothetical protein
VGDIIRGSPTNQDLFSKYVIAPEPTSVQGITRLQGYPKPALLTLIRIALKSEEEFRVRAAATYVFQVCIWNLIVNQQLTTFGALVTTSE